MLGNIGTENYELSVLINHSCPLFLLPFKKVGINPFLVLLIVLEGTVDAPGNIGRKDRHRNDLGMRVIYACAGLFTVVMKYEDVFGALDLFYDLGISFFVYPNDVDKLGL